MKNKTLEENKNLENNNENEKLNSVESLKKEVDGILERNKRVELDKAWETSYTRKICICLLTYAVVLLYSYLIRNITNISIFFTSFVPVIGFTLSTLSLKLIRKIWEKKRKNG